MNTQNFEVLYNSELYEKNIGMVDFVIIDTDYSCSQLVLPVIMRLLSACTALFYCFLKIIFLICFVSKYVVFI